MTDEQQLRALLVKAAEIPDDVLPPVQRLVRLGRRRRSLRAGFRTLTVGVVACAAVAAPQIIRSGLGPSRPGGAHPRPLAVGFRSAGPGPRTPALTNPRWSALPASPLGLRQPDVITWTGQRLLAIGGAVHGKPSRTGAINLRQGVTLDNGQRIRQDETVEFDQARGRWRQLPAPPGRPFATGAVWTGTELLLLTDRGALLGLHS